MGTLIRKRRRISMKKHSTTIFSFLLFFTEILSVVAVGSHETITLRHGRNRIVTNRNNNSIRRLKGSNNKNDNKEAGVNRAKSSNKSNDKVAGTNGLKGSNKSNDKVAGTSGLKGSNKTNNKVAGTSGLK